MGSSINSVSRRLGTPVSIKLHQSFYIPIPKEVRSLLDLWGWGCSTPRIAQRFKPSSYFNVKRNLFFLQTFQSWVASSGNFFVRIRVSDNYSSIGVHLYIFGNLVGKKGINQFSSGCLIFDSNGSCSSRNLVFSTFYIEKSLERLYSKLFRPKTSIVVTIHNILFLIIGNYFDFIADLIVSIKAGYSGRLSSKQFSIGVNVLVCLLHFPYPFLLCDWLVRFIEHNKQATVALSFINETLFCFDPFDCKLRGFSLVVKGRIGGSDKSIKQVVRWGQIPKETLRAGVVTSFAAAFTPQGVIGVRVGLYFLLLFVFNFGFYLPL
jgi:hypothetical protein